MFLLSELVASKFSRGTISQIEPFTVNKVFFVHHRVKRKDRYTFCLLAGPKNWKPSQMKIKQKKGLYKRLT